MAVPRLDRRDVPLAAGELAELDFARAFIGAALLIARAEARSLPMAIGLPLEQMHAFEADQQDVGFAVAIEISDLEIVRHVNVVADSLRLPRSFDRIGWNLINEKRRAVLRVIGPRRVFALQGRDNQVLAAVAVEISKVHAVRCRIFTNWVQRPLTGRIAAAGDPLDRATGLRRIRTARLPGGAEGEIDMAVAVDVVRREADVVLPCLALQDDVLVPIRVFEPEDAVAIDNRNIEPLVAVHIQEPHRIANGQLGRQLLIAELEVSGGDPGGGHKKHY